MVVLDPIAPPIRFPGAIVGITHEKLAGHVVGRNPLHHQKQPVSWSVYLAGWSTCLLPLSGERADATRLRLRSGTSLIRHHRQEQSSVTCCDKTTVGQITKSLTSPSAKIFRFSKRADHLHIYPIPFHRGALRNVTKRGAGCGDAKVLLDGQHRGGRQKRVVLAPRSWCQVLRDERRATVARKPVHRGEYAISRKTSRGECRAMPGVTC